MIALLFFPLVHLLLLICDRAPTDIEWSLMHWSGGKKSSCSRHFFSSSLPVWQRIDQSMNAWAGELDTANSRETKSNPKRDWSTSRIGDVILNTWVATYKLSLMAQVRQLCYLHNMFRVDLASPASLVSSERRLGILHSRVGEATLVWGKVKNFKQKGRSCVCH